MSRAQLRRTSRTRRKKTFRRRARICVTGAESPEQIQEDQMKLTRYGIAVLAGSTLLAAACTTVGAVGITKTEAVVAGCEKVGDVSIDAKTPETDVNNALSDAARRKNANYVVVASDGARAGSAYRCSAPVVPGGQ
jgi:uncharacterized Zn finger protein (UPF0148 family)